MKVSESKAVGPVRTSAPVAGTARSESAGVRTPVDTTSIMGIPEAEFTPKVREAIMSLMQEVDRFRHEIDSAKRRIEHLEKLAENDALTSVLNRRGFVREMTRIKSYADRYNAPATLVFFDLNSFKPVNDEFGHNAGDAVLQKVASVLVENTRDSDVVGRLGGDEFGVILVNNREDAAIVKAQKLAEAIAALRFTTNDKTYAVTASYGTHTFEPGDDPAAAIAKADRAMYASKRAHKTE